MNTNGVDTDEAWFNSARDGNVQMLKYMGSKLRTRDDEGRTALMLYVGNGYSRDLSFFAPEVGLVDNQGFPALKYAVDSRNTTAISYLKDELDISISCGKTLVTCETYLRQHFTGKPSPHERKRGQEVSNVRVCIGVDAEERCWTHRRVSN